MSLQQNPSPRRGFYTPKQSQGFDQLQYNFAVKGLWYVGCQLCWSPGVVGQHSQPGAYNPTKCGGESMSLSLFFCFCFVISFRDILLCNIIV